MIQTFLCDTCDGQRVTVVLEHLPDGRYRATVGERSYTVAARPRGAGWLLDVDGERTTAYVAGRGNERFVALHGGEQYTLALAGPRSARAGAAGGDTTAQMPGQVIEVLVAEGERVERGQTLLILEAMKMELRVTAPSAGVVRRLLVKQGDVVERGQRLVEVES